MNDFKGVCFVSRTDLVLDDFDIPCHSFGRFDTIELPIKKTLERIEISPELAAKIRPVEIRPGVCATSISGKLKVVNNKYTLEALDRSTTPDGGDPDEGGSKSARKRKRGGSVDGGPCQLYGRYDLRQVTQKLTSSMGEARLEQISNGNFIIHMEKINTLIQVDTNNGQTHVVVDGSEGGHDGIRSKIRDILISCLEKY